MMTYSFGKGTTLDNLTGIKGLSELNIKTVKDYDCYLELIEDAIKHKDKVVQYNLRYFDKKIQRNREIDLSRVKKTKSTSNLSLDAVFLENEEDRKSNSITSDYIFNFEDDLINKIDRESVEEKREYYTLKYGVDILALTDSICNGEGNVKENAKILKRLCIKNPELAGIIEQYVGGH